MLSDDTVDFWWVNDGIVWLDNKHVQFMTICCWDKFRKQHCHTILFDYLSDYPTSLAATPLQFQLIATSVPRNKSTMNTAASLLAIALLVCASTAFAPMGIVTKRSELYMRRGRGSGLKRELDDSSSSSSFTGGMGGGSAAPAGGTNWLNTNKSIKELPEEEGKVRFVPYFVNSRCSADHLSIIEKCKFVRNNPYPVAGNRKRLCIFGSRRRTQLVLSLYFYPFIYIELGQNDWNRCIFVGRQGYQPQWCSSNRQIRRRSLLLRSFVPTMQGMSKRNLNTLTDRSKTFVYGKRSNTVSNSHNRLVYCSWLHQILFRLL